MTSDMRNILGQGGDSPGGGYAARGRKGTQWPGGSKAGERYARGWAGAGRDGNERVHRVANFDKNQPKYLSFSSKIPKIFARAFGAWIIYFLIDL